MVCCKWYRRVRSRTYLCLLTDLDIRKVGYFCCPSKLSDGEIHKWHISSKFVYSELCDLTYGYEYPKDKFFHSLRTKQTFYVSVLGASSNWYGTGRISHQRNMSYNVGVHWKKKALTGWALEVYMFLTRLFLPAPPYLLLSPPYISKFPKMPLHNILDYVIRKSFFKFVISFRIT